MKSNEVGVFIKGLKMPPSCCDCDMIELSGAIGCRHAYDMKNSDLDRASDCPLVPVPPHGRLIDADALAKTDRMVGKLMVYGGEYVYTQAEIDRAPTIIPAEEAQDA